MNKKIKLLLLANFIPHYRLPILNMLGEKYDFTIAHYGKLVDDNEANFNQIKLIIKGINGFFFFKENIYKLAKQFDVVISLGELRVIPNILLGLRKRRFGLVYWGIGVTASYDHAFDSNSKIDGIRIWLMNKADSILFYSDYPIKEYVQKGVDSKKLFVANNTVQVTEKVIIPYEKKHFLFVGTLYRQKRLNELLKSYKQYIQITDKILPLVIIGDGDEKVNILNWIKQENLEDKIILTGQINNQQTLKLYYQDSVACVSPGQAGLTVLNSMAYGVPFVTSENAITGGEIFNVRNNENGFIYNGDTNELAGIMKKLAEDNELTYKLSRNAQNYYFNERNAEIMVKGFDDAIEYAFNAKKN